jgi:hypothetical protein
MLSRRVRLTTIGCEVAICHIDSIGHLERSVNIKAIVSEKEFFRC